MYITNKPEIARIAENAGVDRIFVDMEYIGKSSRQGGMDTVQSRHTVDSVAHISHVLTKAELLVRVNPIHDATPNHGSSQEEIEEVIAAGADIIMLPMYRSREQVEQFVRLINGRAKTLLLAETPEACHIMPQVAEMQGVDEIHIGLNDLHLAYQRKFMFELLIDGTVESLCNIIRESGKPYGFGGIARIGYGMLPAEYIISEHYRLGSSITILSRAFCNADKIGDLKVIRELFDTEVARIRREEALVSELSRTSLLKNRETVRELVLKIAQEL